MLGRKYSGTSSAGTLHTTRNRHLGTRATWHEAGAIWRRDQGGSIDGSGNGSWIIRE